MLLQKNASLPLSDSFRVPLLRSYLFTHPKMTNGIQRAERIETFGFTERLDYS